MLLSFSFVLSVSPEGFVVVSVAFVVTSPLKDGVDGGRVEGSVAGGGVVSGPAVRSVREVDLLSQMGSWEELDG